jgi:hypothetical protein
MKKETKETRMRLKKQGNQNWRKGLRIQEWQRRTEFKWKKERMKINAHSNWTNKNETEETRESKMKKEIENTRMTTKNWIQTEERE